MVHRVWLCVVWLALAGLARSQESGLEAAVDHLFEAMDRPDRPGAAVLVRRDGRAILSKGYGCADLEHAVPITPQTVFDIASVSKQFCGLAVAQLVTEGELQLDDDVRRHLATFPDFGTTVTVGHLVHHTSGLRDWPGALAVAGWRMDDVISFEQILTFLSHQQELNFEPGARYSYSNTGYNALARLVEQRSGDTFRAWMQERVFGPLGMDDSHFQDDHGEVIANRAWGYRRASEGYVRLPNGLTALGSSSLFSTVEDLDAWLANFEQPKVGGDGALRLMETRGVLNSGEVLAYAFGQSRRSYRGATTWSHSGSWAGSRTVLLRLPEHGLGIVILSNDAGFDASGRAHEIVDLILGDVLEDPAPSPAPGDPPVESTPEPPEVDLDGYAGVYRSDELDTRYQLVVRGEGLVALHRRHGSIALALEGADRFRGEVWFLRTVEFDRDEGGEVSGLRVSNGRSQNLRFRRIDG